MSRKRSRGVNYLRVYPGLNDMSDALEALPLEMVRHFTLLKEIDAKCTGLAPQLSDGIVKFLSSDREDAHREDDLKKLIGMLKEIMPCIEEKMHVANMAADTMTRHIERVNTDYQLIVDHEIPKDLQIDYHDPALMEIRAPEPPAGTPRAESVREAAATRRAAAAREATREAENSSRGGTPLPRAPGRRRYPPVIADGENESDDKTELPRRRRTDKNDPVYCYCERAGFGDMVGCDGPDCQREWFHLGCIGLTAVPKGQWFCEECSAKYRRGDVKAR